MSNEEQPAIVPNEEPSSSLTSDGPRLSLVERIKSLRPESIFPTALQTKLGGFSRVGASVLIVLIASGIGYGGIVVDHHLNQPKQHFTAKIAPFAIESTSPNSGAADLNTVSKIVINFNKPVDPAKLKGDFWIKPAVEGTFSQKSSNQAIFTPTLPLADGVVYNVMIHSEFASKSGTPLGADYNFNFITATPDTSVIFTTDSDRGAFGSSPLGKDQIYTLSVGKAVDPSGEVGIYKANQAQLLNALKSGEASGVSRNESSMMVYDQVKTDQMTLVQTQKGLTDGETVKLNLPAGTYVVAATANKIQVGYTWLVVTDLGVALRQDDQKIVLAISSLTTSQPISANVKIYNFNNSDAPLADSTIDGVGSINFPYSQKSQWAVVTTGDDTAVVPINTDYSLADLRVDQDFSKATRSFGLTNKPTYFVGENVKFSGYVYTDNDVHFKPFANRQLQVFVATDKWGTHLADSTLSTDSSGSVTGSFLINESWMSGAKSANLSIFVKDDSSTLDWLADSQLASFTAVSTPTASNDVTVSFPKTQYLATDAISANIIVKTKDGATLSGGNVSVNIFATPYDESSTVAPRIISDNPGELLNQDPIEVSLDGNGMASVPIDVSSLPSGSSQVLTVQASADADAAGNIAAGGASVIVHQGLGKLIFGPFITKIPTGGTLISRVYARTLAGTPLANTTIQYTLTGGQYGTNTPVQIGSGSSTSDANGFVQISQNIGSYGTNKRSDGSDLDSGRMTLNVSTADASNDKIENTSNYDVGLPNVYIAHSDLQLSKIDISGSSTAVVVGQTLKLTVNVPEDIHALATIDRGRIYKYETVDLKQGDNTYSVEVTPDMLPSFNLSFSYFDANGYQVEGASFKVSPDPKESAITITPNQSSFNAGDTATFQIKAMDASGNPIYSNLIVGVADEKMYRLNNQPVADIANLYLPRETSISSSSSLTGIGSGGGGGCGPGGSGYSGSQSLLNATGNSIYWNPTASTRTDGTTSFQLKLPKGTWRVFVYSIDQAVNVGSAYIDVTAK